MTAILMLILTCGCRLDKLHDDEVPSDTFDPCDSIDIDDFIYYDYKASDIIYIGDSYILCGSRDNSSDIFLMKINETGDEEFFEEHTIGTNAAANSVVQLKDGSGYLICGSVTNNGSQRAFFAKYDNSGKLLSNKEGDPKTYCEHITYANEQYVFTGYKGEIGIENIYVGIVDISSDNITIDKTYFANNSGRQKVYAVQEFDNNEYLFAGHSIEDINYAVPYVFRLDTDLNAGSFIRCEEAYENPNNIDEIYITCMTPTNDYGYMFAGYFKKTSGNQLNAFTLKMDNNCNYSDIYTYESTETVEIRDIARVDEGNYLICGNKKVGNSRYVHAMKLNSDGDILQEYPDASNINGKIFGLAVESDCNYMMAGHTGGNNTLVVKIAQ